MQICIKKIKKRNYYKTFFEKIKIIIFQVVVVYVTNRGDGYRCFQGYLGQVIYPSVPYLKDHHQKEN